MFNEQPGDAQLRTCGAFVSRNIGGKTVCEWTRIDILPATTVFYEEGFMNTVDGSFGGGITANWETVGSAQSAMQSYENGDYGYDSAYEGSFGDSLGGGSLDAHGCYCADINRDGTVDPDEDMYCVELAGSAGGMQIFGSN